MTPLDDDFPVLTPDRASTQTAGRLQAVGDPLADLPDGYTWSTVLPADHEASAEHRHVVYEYSRVSLCGIATMPRLWKVNRTKPYCPACVEVVDREDLGSVNITRTVSIVRHETGRGQVTEVTDHVNGPRQVLRRHLDESAADTVEALLRAGAITVDEEIVFADKDGIFETLDGSCLRDSDPATEHRLHRLVITTGWTRRAEAAPLATQPPPAADGEF